MTTGSAKPEQELLGLLGFVLVVAILFAVVAFIVANAPISVYCLGALLAAGGLHLLIRTLDNDDILPRGKLAKAAFEDLRRSALLFAGGMGIAWAVQTALNLARDRTQPDQVGEVEMSFYTLAASLKSYASLPMALAIVGGALLLSLAIQAWWPLVAAGMLRKLLSRALGVIAALSLVSFVTIDHADKRFDFATAPIRAAIDVDLLATIAARQDSAALRWLTAEIERHPPPADAVATLRDIDTRGKAACARTGAAASPPWVERGEDCNWNAIAVRATADAFPDQPAPDTNAVEDAFSPETFGRPEREEEAPRDLVWLPDFARLVRVRPADPTAVDGGPAFAPVRATQPATRPAGAARPRKGGAERRRGGRGRCPRRRGQGVRTGDRLAVRRSDRRPVRGVARCPARQGRQGRRGSGETAAVRPEEPPPPARWRDARRRAGAAAAHACAEARPDRRVRPGAGRNLSRGTGHQARAGQGDGRGSGPHRARGGALPRRASARRGDPRHMSRVLAETRDKLRSR